MPVKKRKNVFLNTVPRRGIHIQHGSTWTPVRIQQNELMKRQTNQQITYKFTSDIASVDFIVLKKILTTRRCKTMGRENTGYRQSFFSRSTVSVVCCSGREACTNSGRIGCSR